jgi:serine/threonine-protein kinase
MPLVEHGTLKGLLRGEPVSTDEMYRVISQVGDALHHTHSIGVIHRDVKPSNVLLDRYGNCMLTDFGIAKLASRAAQFTGTGVSVGTPVYMSPEQALAGAMDHRSDIYSLGVVLYQMATGRVPFKGKTAIATALMHINDPLPSPRAASPALTPEIERVIERSLAKQPMDRYATASEMVSDLQEAMLGRG